MCQFTGLPCFIALYFSRNTEAIRYGVMATSATPMTVNIVAVYAACPIKRNGLTRSLQPC